MRNLVYVMHGESPAPAGDGDTESWFHYYKWPDDGDGDFDAFVPKSYPFLEAAPGDRLWFVLDGKVVGYAPLTQVETPPHPAQKQELWYYTGEIVKNEQGFESDWASMAETMELADEVFERWLSMMKRES